MSKSRNMFGRGGGGVGLPLAVNLTGFVHSTGSVSLVATSFHLYLRGLLARIRRTNFHVRGRQCTLSVPIVVVDKQDQALRVSKSASLRAVEGSGFGG